jgi:hypothetical protein
MKDEARNRPSCHSGHRALFLPSRAGVQNLSPSRRQASSVFRLPHFFRRAALSRVVSPPTSWGDQRGEFFCHSVPRTTRPESRLARRAGVADPAGIGSHGRARLHRPPNSPRILRERIRSPRVSVLPRETTEFSSMDTIVTYAGKKAFLHAFPHFTNSFKRLRSLK